MPVFHQIVEGEAGGSAVHNAGLGVAAEVEIGVTAGVVQREDVVLRGGNESERDLRDFLQRVLRDIVDGGKHDHYVALVAAFTVAHCHALAVHAGNAIHYRSVAGEVAQNSPAFLFGHLSAHFVALKVFLKKRLFGKAAERGAQKKKHQKLFHKNTLYALIKFFY